MIGKKVRVYFNLHKKVYSVQCRKTGLVIAHVDKLCLSDVSYNVRQGGRQKVLKEQRKNVHAFIEGTVCCPVETIGAKWYGVTYNPYKYDSFVVRETETPIKGSTFANLELAGTRPVTYGGGLAWVA
jgi:hypothetical protein